MCSEFQETLLYPSHAVGHTHNVQYKLQHAIDTLSLKLKRGHYVICLPRTTNLHLLFRWIIRKPGLRSIFHPPPPSGFKPTKNEKNEGKVVSWLVTFSRLQKWLEKWNVMIEKATRNLNNEMWKAQYVSSKCKGRWSHAPAPLLHALREQHHVHDMRTLKSAIIHAISLPTTQQPRHISKLSSYHTENTVLVDYNNQNINYVHENIHLLWEPNGRYNILSSQIQRFSLLQQVVHMITMGL